MCLSSVAILSLLFLRASLKSIIHQITNTLASCSFAFTFHSALGPWCESHMEIIPIFIYMWSPNPCWRNPNGRRLNLLWGINHFFLRVAFVVRSQLVTVGTLWLRRDDGEWRHGGFGRYLWRVWNFYDGGQQQRYIILTIARCVVVWMDRGWMNGVLRWKCRIVWERIKGRHGCVLSVWLENKALYSLLIILISYLWYISDRSCCGMAIV